MSGYIVLLVVSLVAWVVVLGAGAFTYSLLPAMLAAFALLMLYRLEVDNG